MDVSDRRLQVQLTQQAKILSTFLFFERIFAFAGFVSGLAAQIKDLSRALMGKKPLPLASLLQPRLGDTHNAAKSKTQPLHA